LVQNFLARSWPEVSPEIGREVSVRIGLNLARNWQEVDRVIDKNFEGQIGLVLVLLLSISKLSKMWANWLWWQ
jgi:hypothetical protein